MLKEPTMEIVDTQENRANGNSEKKEDYEFDVLKNWGDIKVIPTEELLLTRHIKHKPISPELVEEIEEEMLERPTEDLVGIIDVLENIDKGGKTNEFRNWRRLRRRVEEEIIERQETGENEVRPEKSNQDEEWLDFINQMSELDDADVEELDGQTQKEQGLETRKWVQKQGPKGGMVQARDGRFRGSKTDNYSYDNQEKFIRKEEFGRQDIAEALWNPDQDEGPPQNEPYSEEEWEYYYDLFRRPERLTEYEPPASEMSEDEYKQYVKNEVRRVKNLEPEKKWERKQRQFSIGGADNRPR